MTIKIAVIGLGWVGVNRHIRTLLKDPQFEVIGVIDRRSGRAANVAHEFNVMHHSQSENLEEIDWLTKADMLTIATPPHSHYDLVTQAIRLNKHVLVEKPFTLEREQAIKLQNEIRSKNTQLFIVHNFQFSDSFTRLLRDYECGKLGDITSVVARQFGNPRRRLPSWYETLPLGLFYDESPHLLYLLNRLAPEGLTLQSATSMPSNEGLETPSVIEALYQANINNRKIPFSLHMSFEAPVSEWHLALMGKEGVGIVDLFRDIYIFVPNDEQHTAKTVITTSLLSTLQHWWQTASQGLKHLRGTLLYGNDVLYNNIAIAIKQSKTPPYIDSDAAATILHMQHDLIELLHRSKSPTVEDA